MNIHKNKNTSLGRRSRLDPERETKVKMGKKPLFAMGLIVVGLSIWLVFGLSSHKASADTEIIKSGIDGYCLDVYRNNTAPGAQVYSWTCNGSESQKWLVNTTSITHNGNNCLSVNNDDQIVSSSVVLDKCDGSPGQVWLRDRGGYFNPNSRLCLAVPNSQTSTQVVIGSCNYVKYSYGQWTPIADDGKGQEVASQDCEQLSGGQRIACNAVKEWTAWQSGKPDHNALLTSYTNNAPYEQWCADFISYVFKESGYPFKGGESNGWDENNANNIQNMGFTLHKADSNYVPKAGDVAYFNYNGGHVEIVISGGAHPSFVYGDSAIKDPATGNGQMMSNTIIKDGDEGQLAYYLSHNIYN